MIQENYDFSKSKRNKSVLSIEARLNELVATDPRNEEIYHLLKRLAEIFINKNKYVYGYNGVDEVVHDVASDVWISVLNGKKIYAWSYYIGKMIKLTYITKQKQIEHEVINTIGDPDLEEGIINMCAGSSLSNIRQFDEMLSGLMLDNIDAMIRDVMKHIKFKEGTYEWLQLYTNVCINLVRSFDGEPLKYFKLDESLEHYVPLIIEQFKEKFRNSGFADSIMTGVDERLNVLEDYEERRKDDDD